MSAKRTGRLGKWLCKALGSYAAFIALGMLLSRIPAEQIGLHEPMFTNLRMCFMLFGPIYLTLIAKILLAFIASARGQVRDVAEDGRGILFTLTALLLLVNLSQAQTVSDLASGHVQGKGLRTLQNSRNVSPRGKRFLNVFLPVCTYLLILELLTLLVSILCFAPLSRAASNAWIVSIAVTALCLLCIPLILSLVTGFQGDRARHAKKLAREKQDALRSEHLVLESDPVRRKEFLHAARRLLLLPLFCLLFCGVGLRLTRDVPLTSAIQFGRNLWMFLSAASLFSCFLLLLYWANCSGTSLVQRIVLSHDQFCYSGYSGSMDERVSFSFTLTQLISWRVGRRWIRICGQFQKTTQDVHGTSHKLLPRKTLYLPRTFSHEQEQALLQFLQRQEQAASQGDHSPR